MKISIEAEANEIADLVLALQGQHTENKTIVEDIAEKLANAVSKVGEQANRSTTCDTLRENQRSIRSSDDAVSI